MIDATEALANALIGLLVSWVATWLLMPSWGCSLSPIASAGVTGMFFTTSFARAWILRAYFRRRANG